MTRVDNRVTRRQIMATSALAAPLFVRGAFGLLKQDEERATRLLQYRNLKKYTVRHTVSFDVGDIDLTSLELWLPVPQTNISQKIENLKSNKAAKYYFDQSGTSKIACLMKTEDLPAANSKYKFEVTYDVTTVSTILQTDQLEKLNDRWYDEEVELDDAYLKSEKYIQTELSKIKELAQDLKKDHRSAYTTARAIYEWILDHVEYKLIDGFGGAKYCIENGHGECGDYVALFIAVCRAAGIPSRPVVGFWAGKKNDWHVWAEFLMPNGEWLPVDLSIGDQSPRNRRLFFGSLDNRRVALNRTFEMTFDKPGKHTKSDFLQVGNWYYQGSRLDGEPKISYSVDSALVE